MAVVLGDWGKHRLALCEIARVQVSGTKMRAAVSKWTADAGVIQGENLIALSRWWNALFLLFAASMLLCAQNAAKPAASQGQTVAAQPSPGAEYKSAKRPLDVVRESLDNWSDAELGVLAVGIHRAQVACHARKAEDFAGDDLYNLARLCSFGQDWNSANAAATRYIDSRAPTYRAQAYALSINAWVRLNGVDVAIETARTMLRSVPYDAEVAYAVRYLKDDLEQAGNPLAVKVAQDEHGAIVQALAAGAPLKAAHGDAVISVELLYDSAMELAFFDKFEGKDYEADSAAEDCDDALTRVQAIAPEDRQRIDAVRLQFGLLGKSLPSFAMLKALSSPTAKAAIEGELGVGTVFVVFPDWCAQCRTMMKTMTQFAKVNATTPLHEYGLMFSETGEGGDRRIQAEMVKELAGTNTFRVPADTAKTFGALDFPTAIAVDTRGVIRFIGMIPTNAFNDNGCMEKVFVRMAKVETMEGEPVLQGAGAQ